MNSFLFFLCFSCSAFITSHTMHSSFCAVFWGPLSGVYFCGLYFTYPCLSYF